MSFLSIFFIHFILIENLVNLKSIMEKARLIRIVVVIAIIGEAVSALQKKINRNFIHF